MEHVISYSEARQNFKSVCDLTHDDQIPVFIKRKDGRNVVVLSEEEYNALDETAYLLSSSKNAQHLQTSLEEFSNSDTKSFDGWDNLEE